MQREEEALDLLFTAKERLSSPDMGTFKSLLLDEKYNRIGRSQFDTSVLLLFEKDQYLRHRFIQYAYGYNSRPSKQEDEVVTGIEEGEIPQDPKIEAGLEIRVEGDENRKEDRSHGDQKIRVKVNENPKKGSIGKREINSLLGKKTKKGKLGGKLVKDSKQLERVTPSYTLILGGKETPVSVSDDEVLNCLNNKYRTVYPSIDDEWNHKKLPNHEQAMADCEEDMYEADMLREALDNALARAERVLEGTMRLEDLGAKFYRCINILYSLDDMVEIVSQNHQEALTMIIRRLKQKLYELEMVRERWVPVWKQVFKENTTKQRDSTAHGQKENNKI